MLRVLLFTDQFLSGWARKLMNTQHINGRYTFVVQTLKICLHLFPKLFFHCTLHSHLLYEKFTNPLIKFPNSDGENLRYLESYGFISLLT